VNLSQAKSNDSKVASFFGVFVMAALGEISGAKEQFSRKDAKSQKRAKSKLRH
jgi:hypothetical protein